mmetsp:Transcript_9718/g.31737  ORF Transcript_9718/g.31737 Transcript_9718/m.31737 type:complete len:232 (-) Transcript_9718:70-765(-)
MRSTLPGGKSAAGDASSVPLRASTPRDAMKSTASPSSSKHDTAAGNGAPRLIASDDSAPQPPPTSTTDSRAAPAGRCRATKAHWALARRATNLGGDVRRGRGGGGRERRRDARRDDRVGRQVPAVGVVVVDVVEPRERRGRRGRVHELDARLVVLDDVGVELRVSHHVAHAHVAPRDRRRGDAPRRFQLIGVRLFLLEDAARGLELDGRRAREDDHGQEMANNFLVLGTRW